MSPDPVRAMWTVAGLTWALLIGWVALASSASAEPATPSPSLMQHRLAGIDP